jgi:uncharacterized protein with GYD domain
MSTYVMLINYTDQGIRQVKDSPKRIDAARGLAKACGAEIKDVYMTMGEYDLIAIVEAPDDGAFAKLALKVSALGNVRSTTLKAFSEDEYKDIIENLP